MSRFDLIENSVISLAPITWPVYHRSPAEQVTGKRQDDMAAHRLLAGRFERQNVGPAGGGTHQDGGVVGIEQAPNPGSHLIGVPRRKARLLRIGRVHPSSG